MNRPPEPTPDQLAAMAYADGELPAEERTAFEARLAVDPALAREVAELKRLDVLARHMAPPEPADAEWKRLSRDSLQRGASALGYGLLLVAGLGGTVLSVVLVLLSELPFLGKVALLSGVAGAFVLLLAALRARLRVLPFDPYTHVQR